MPSSLVLAVDSEKYVAQFLAQPGHALLVVGPSGAGKTAVAKYIAAKLLGDFG